MAKKSMIERERKRQKLVDQYAERRAALKAAASDKNASVEERFKATLKLADGATAGGDVLIEGAHAP